LPGHGIRYFSGFALSVPVSEFERKSAGFIEAVLEATLPGSFSIHRPFNPKKTPRACAHYPGNQRSLNLEPSCCILKFIYDRIHDPDVLEHIRRVGKVLYSGEGNVDLEALIKDKV